MLRIHRSVKLVITCLAYLAGVLWASTGKLDTHIIFLRDHATFFVIVAIWALVTTLFWLREKNLALLLLIPTFLLLGITQYISRAYPVLTKSHIGYWVYQGPVHYPIWGTVVSHPEMRGSEQRFFLGDISLENSGKTELYGSIMVELPGTLSVEYGDQVSMTARLQQPLSFGDFDYRIYLVRHGAFGIAKEADEVVISPPRELSIVRSLFDLRALIISRIDRLFPDPRNALAVGMLIGDTQFFSKEMNDAYRATGLTHIVALSGFNITILLVSLQKILRRLGRRRVFGISLIVVVLFVLMTGASASLTRAAIMGLLFAAGSVIGRQNTGFVIVVLAASVMALANPLIVPHDVAFQLSFLATLGLMAASTFFDTVLKKIPSIIREPVATTLAAQVFVLPILVETFGQVSIIAPLSNLLVLPLVPLIMLGTFVAMLVSYIWTWPAVAVSWATSFMIQWVDGAALLLARIPWAVIETKSSFGFWWGVYYLLAAGGLYLWNRKIGKEKATR